MNNDEIRNAELLALEAIHRVRSKNLDESLRWICEKQYYIESSSITFETEPGFDEIEVIIKEGHSTFIITYENARSVYTPDENVTMGDFCLNYNGADVLRTSWSKRRDDEWSSSYYTIHLVSTDSVKTLMLGDWLNEITAIVSKLKIEKEQKESERQTEERAAEANRILNHFDLGNDSTKDEA
tara:strand:- start:1710 stop:2258 length:549 start_codon:yes stop_codon:yes gene_type:complete